MKAVAIIFAACALTLSAQHSCAQTALYGEFSASQFTGGPAGDYLYGGSTGALLKAGTIGPHISVIANVQGRFVEKSGEGVNELNVGPRFAFTFKRLHRYTPYAEFLVGFARYHDTTNNGPTDSMIQANGGITRMISHHWDAVIDYSWSRYGAFQNMYNPQTFSVGAIFNFTR